MGKTISSGMWSVFRQDVLGIEEELTEAEKMGQWVDCLPSKPEDASLGSG